MFLINVLSFYDNCHGFLSLYNLFVDFLRNVTSFEIRVKLCQIRKNSIFNLSKQNRQLCHTELYLFFTFRKRKKLKFLQESCCLFYMRSNIHLIHEKLKVHLHEFFSTFFAETETVWSPGPVTRDFLISYSIWPRYLTFKHFRVCSGCDEIISMYAQPAFKSFPHMLRER
jgi:hypothetical protein